jgi:syringomycin synthetase protein SyrE
MLKTVPVKGDHASMWSRPNVVGLGSVISSIIHASENAPANRVDFPHSSSFTIKAGRRDDLSVFCVPGVSPSSVDFFELSQHLQKVGSVYGLEPRGLDISFVPHSTVTASAAAHLRALDEINPQGPLHLLGYSFGGWVAFEMAQRLSAIKRPIASLILLGTDPPNSEHTIREFSRTEAIMRWISMYEQLIERPLGIEPSDLHMRAESNQLELIHSTLVREKLLPHHSNVSVLHGPLRAFCAQLRTSYNPATTYLGNVHLLSAADPLITHSRTSHTHQANTEKWKIFAPNLRSWSVTGNHATMLRPPQAAALALLIDTIHDERCTFGVVDSVESTLV